MVKNAINLKTPASGALIALRGETHVETLSHLGVRVFVYLGNLLSAKIAINNLWQNNSSALHVVMLEEVNQKLKATDL